MFEMILMMKRNFTLGFVKHLLRSVSEITRKNSLIRSIQKQPSRGVLRKRFSEHIADFQNTFSYEHLWVAASEVSE